MEDPRPLIRTLIRDGHAILAELARSSNPVGGVVVREGTRWMADALIGGSWARHASKAAAASLLANQERQATQACDSWFSQVGRQLEGMSSAPQKLTTRGNSARLVAGLQASRKAAKATTRLRRGISYLERLLGQPLVFNRDIPELLKQRMLEARAEKRRIAELHLLDLPALVPGIDALRFPHLAALRSQLEAFPDETPMMEAAINAFLGDSPDRFRHAATSARSALEGSGIKVTGAGPKTWKDAARAKMPDEVGKVLSNTYALLSSLAHTGRKPTAGTVELALKQSMHLMVWFGQHAALWKPATP